MYGNFSQTVDPAPYRGKRIQVSVTLERFSRDDSASFWFFFEVNKKLTVRDVEVDHEPGSPPATYTLTLDIPADAERIGVAVLFGAPGKVAVKRFGVREVGPEVPVTPEPPRRAPKKDQ